jgi:tRNA threonylcarbamoyladenosine biosynthesis protein TsaB
MSLLAIETSSSQGSLALSHNGEVLQLKLSEQRKQIAELLPSINNLLAQASLTLGDLQGLVLSAGPGSFTGLRVGMGVVQGLGLAQDLPVMCLSSLQILAQTAHRILKVEQITCAVNAYMQQIYYAHYAMKKGIMEANYQDCLIAPNEVPKPIEPMNLVGDAWEVYAEQLQQTAYHILYPSAEDALTIAAHKDAWQPVSAIDVNYLRTKSAWQKN